MTDRFDYIITGAGAAGLSLAFHLNNAGLTDKRILLIDKAPKAENDRTWCFWEAGDNAFESIVFRKWDHVAFHGNRFSKVLHLAPYRYKMIRGIDFYAFMSDWLKSQPNITQVYGTVDGVEDTSDGVAVDVEGRRYEGAWAFNSIQFTSPAQQPSKYHYLLQHFLGWVIQTPEAKFDPRQATLMDFRIPQAGETRFVYVLPFDPHTALVEFTVFSGKLLERGEYKRELETYITNQLQITEYEEQHEEFGVIPMTDAPFPEPAGARVINIGTAGGRTKPSTGYTFRRIQRHSAQIAQALKDTGAPFFPTPLPSRRFELFDSTLLNVLDKGRDAGKQVFTDMFSRNPPQRVFKFLDEDTTLAEDLQIMSSVNLPAFSLATAEAIFRRMRKTE
jgi:lycopene beta-cyclase